jgi:Flp pilus assembly protein TadD
MSDNANALQLGLRHHNAGNLAEAERIYRQILTVDPRHADSLHLLGVIAFHAGRADASRELIQKAIAINPAVPEYHSNLGNVLKAFGDVENAIASYRQALALRPEFADAQYNLGNAFLNDERLEEALTHYREALRIRPDYAPAWVNIGNTLRSLGRIGEALEFYDKIQAGAPDFAEARWNRAIALLLSGNYAAGWEAYECRWDLLRARPRLRSFVQPQWDGSDLAGRTILLHAEQGAGDTIQFVRYAPLVSRLGARVLVECQPSLVDLVAGMQGVDKVVAAGDSLPQFDVHLPLLSTPRVFRTSRDNVPATVPYLQPVRGRKWTGKLSRSKNVMKVGLVWAGGTSDTRRDCGLAAFGALSGVANVQFVSLQVGDAVAQLAGKPAAMTLIDASTGIADFADTAALIDKLDLVISVDTSVAHLAGALAKPVWTLLRFAPDWRWLLGTKKSAWYPTMRLYRQHAPGDWSRVIADVAQDLAAEARRHKA